MFGKGQLGECQVEELCGAVRGAADKRGKEQMAMSLECQAQGLRSVPSRKLSQEQMMGNQAS